MKRKLVRKPRNFIHDVQDFYTSDCIYDDQAIIVLCNTSTSRVSVLKIKEAKRLHKWLGQAIKYLEQKK